MLIYPSNWIRFPVVTWLLAFSLVSSFRSPADCLPGERSGCMAQCSSSSGFGCIKMKGSSATRSLSYKFKRLLLKFRARMKDWGELKKICFKIKKKRIDAEITHPPKIGPPMQSFTLTLYCTIIPKFSRCDGSAILQEENDNNKDKRAEQKKLRTHNQFNWIRNDKRCNLAST